VAAVPLVWRIREDRRRDRADVLRADIRSAINRRLHGESLLAVEVVPKTLWHPGRIVLRTPAGYEDLTETVWRDVARRMPFDYDLVVKPGHAEAPPGRPACRRGRKQRRPLMSRRLRLTPVLLVAALGVALLVHMSPSRAGSAVDPAPTRAVDGVALTVADMDRAVTFYST